MTPRLVRIVKVAAAGVFSAGVLAACGSNDDEMVLDTETLQAQTEFGAVQAQRADVSYVASVGEGRAIGISFADQIGTESHVDERDEVVVFLYDGDQLAVMTGELDATGGARLASGELSDFEATVELSMGSGAVSGMVAFADERPGEFTAEVATGTAGVYWAQGAADDPEVTCDWLVLADGSQWGCICGPPFIGACCEWRL